METGWNQKNDKMNSGAAVLAMAPEFVPTDRDIHEPAGEARRGLLAPVITPLTSIVEAAAAALLAADLAVVAMAVLYRYVLVQPLEWSDDVARALMIALSFFGAAVAVARNENAAIEFFVNLLSQRARHMLEGIATLVVFVCACSAAYFAWMIGNYSLGQVTGSGLPLVYFYYPMAVGLTLMAIFSLDRLISRPLNELAIILAVGVVVAAVAWLIHALAPALVPNPLIILLIGFVVALIGGVPIGFAIVAGSLLYVLSANNVPGLIVAQQMTRGIDNFVLLAVPFFILVGYLMTGNGMSVRLIRLLEMLVGRVRGGLNVVLVLSMVLFSGISGSKMADVAAVGSVLSPAARRAGQKPGDTVALLAASSVMAETIPPCINLIILGFVANLSIGGLFIAGIIPSALMALVLIIVGIRLGTCTPVENLDRKGQSLTRIWLGAMVSVGLILIVFVGFKSGFATATEISAFAAIYCLFVGGLAFRELGILGSYRSFVDAAVRSGLVLFIVSAAQGLAFILTINQIPHRIADALVRLSSVGGSALFMVLSILILMIMGSVLEGAAALIIFAPLLMPTAVALGIHGLHYGIVLVVAMGIGLFAPPLGVGLYSTCLITNTPFEQTVRPTLKYMGVMLICLLILAFVPQLSLWLPHLAGY